MQPYAFPREGWPPELEGDASQWQQVLDAAVAEAKAHEQEHRKQVIGTDGSVQLQLMGEEVRSLPFWTFIFVDSKLTIPNPLSRFGCSRNFSKIFCFDSLTFIGVYTVFCCFFIIILCCDVHSSVDVSSPEPFAHPLEPSF